jgi:hypothetical protein
MQSFFLSATFRCICATALMFLTGCSVFNARTTVQVPVPVECQEKVPARPAMPTEALTAKPTIDQLLKHQDAEIVVREAYEAQLRTALVICTTPIQP